MHHGRGCTLQRLPRGLPGGWGRYDAASEQFAFGYLLYNLVTGVELHEELGPETTDFLRDLEFPPLAEAPWSAWR